MFLSNDMIAEKPWKEFKDAGCLWFINRLLHLFGWAIVYEYDMSDNIQRVYPARVKFRGFDENIESEGFIKVTKFLKDNIKELEKETND